MYLTASNTEVRKYLDSVNDVIIALGLNDLSNGRSAAQLLADVDAFTAVCVAAGKRVFICTIGSSASSSNNFTDYAGQTLPGWEAQRILYNDGIRFRASINRIGVIDMADFLEVGPTGEFQRNGGRWPFRTGVNNWATPDGIHRSRDFNLSIARTGAIRSALGV